MGKLIFSYEANNVLHTKILSFLVHICAHINLIIDLDRIRDHLAILSCICVLILYFYYFQATSERKLKEMKMEEVGALETKTPHKEVIF